jgi:hypothetical protein
MAGFSRRRETRISLAHTLRLLPDLLWIRQRAALSHGYGAQRNESPVVSNAATVSSSDAGSLR